MKLLLLGKNARTNPRHCVDVLDGVKFPKRFNPKTVPDIFGLMGRALLRLPRADGAEFEADDEAWNMMEIQGFALVAMGYQFDLANPVFRGCPIWVIATGGMK